MDERVEIYFIELLERTEERIIGDWETERRDEEEEIGKEEFKNILRKIRRGNALGKDGIPNEVWKYGGQEVEEWARPMGNRVWRGEGWPEEWKEGQISPIVKKGERTVVQDYRGVTLMPTLYREYAMCLAGRLEKIERKNISHNEIGFRKGMGKIDNIYVINYLANKQISKK